jgi:NADPH:quinone reductase-like Zn-dependent oxidoreductase
LKAFTIENQGTAQATVVPRDRPTPTPGPHQVLVRIYARALNQRDVLILEGRYAMSAKAGVVPLSDGASEMVAIGEKVQTVRVGDKVTTVYFPYRRSGSFMRAYAGEQYGCTRDGVLAELNRPIAG